MTLQNFKSMASQVLPQWIHIQPSRKHTRCGYKASMEVTPGKGVQIQQMQSFLTWQSAETLNEFRRQPLGLLQAIGVGNKFRRAGLHSILKMGQNQRVCKGRGVIR